jgi:hypothetical protein
VAITGFLGVMYIVLLESMTEYQFSLFPSESCIKLFLGGEWFPSLFLLPITLLATVQLCS